MVDENLREINRRERKVEGSGTEEKWGWWVLYSYEAVIRTISVANDLTAFPDKLPRIRSSFHFIFLFFFLYFAFFCLLVFTWFSFLLLL